MHMLSAKLPKYMQVISNIEQTLPMPIVGVHQTRLKGIISLVGRDWQYVAALYDGDVA